MNNINQILQKWPQGTVITTSWLRKKGVSRQSTNNYKKSGWIERIGQGAYKRKGEDVTWEGGLYALQKLQNLSIHVGGRTALELHGFGHYLKINSNQVVLWKTPEVRLPSWFQAYNWKTDLQIRSNTLFSKSKEGLSFKNLNQIKITISSAERAILEFLSEVPNHEGFDEANYIMEGLNSLRPYLLQELLETCNSIRVKRLFMYLADYYKHSWFKRLDSSTIDFGQGKREIIKGGKLNNKYKIVVPKLLREDQ